MAEQSPDRTAAVANALLQIEKQFGKGSIMKLGGREKIEVQSIPTGSISLDAALGVGGFPKGRVIEIYGPESSGKTTLALHVIAESQKRGGMAASSMPNMRSTRSTRASWASTSTTSSSPSPTTASRRSKSPRFSSGRMRATFSSSTPSRPSCRARKSKARWATRRWACRPVS